LEAKTYKRKWQKPAGCGRKMGCSVRKLIKIIIIIGIS
jgi:hypothetical protein